MKQGEFRRLFKPRTFFIDCTYLITSNMKVFLFAGCKIYTFSSLEEETLHLHHKWLIVKIYILSMR